MSQIILIFCLLKYFFAEDTDECATEFETILKNKCEIIDSKCVYDTNFEPSCNRFGSCEDPEVYNDKELCRYTVSTNIYSGKRCEYYGYCVEKSRYCSDYKIPLYDLNIRMKEDNCNNLINGGVGECRLIANGKCDSGFSECSNPRIYESDCKYFIPDRTKKCIWDEGSSSCIEDVRYCNDLLPVIDKEHCSELKTSDSTKKCIYKKENIVLCKEVYPTCEQYSQSSCNGQTPLNLRGNDYDYVYKCQFDASKSRCTKVKRNCHEFNSTLGDDENICLKLSATDPNHKICVFINGKCEEKYKTCKSYNDNEEIKTREGCEEMVFPEEKEKCVYNIKENICESRKNYSKCEEYKGSNELICQSIISSKNKKNCVLQKKENDFICRERYFPCSEAYSKNECYIFAKPVDKNKICVFDEINNKCLEQYKKCEKYTGNNLDECEKINIYNGKKCVFESGICKSKNKKCSEALNEDECEIIKNIGISEQNKICDFISGSCQENYKYCSDYTGTDETICKNIKPYDDSGINIDNNYKCSIEEDICKKVPKDCVDAGSNRFLCANISSIIKNNDKKYCSFYQNNCREDYKACEYFSTIYSTGQSICEGIIQENSEIPRCEFNKNYKCKPVEHCHLFNKDDYANLCHKINLKCKYEKGICKKVEKSCSEIIFYTESEENEQICKSFKPINIDKICRIKKDKSGCEEVYNFPKNLEETENEESKKEDGKINENSNLSGNEDKANNRNENENSPMLGKKRILIGIIMACLLF